MKRPSIKRVYTASVRVGDEYFDVDFTVGRYLPQALNKPAEDADVTVVKICDETGHEVSDEAFEKLAEETTLIEACLKHAAQPDENEGL